MAESTRSRCALADKPHHVTIPVEDWSDLTQRKCVSAFSQKYGVSGTEVFRQVQRGDLDNRTFQIIHPYPLYVSRNELAADSEVLKRICAERNLSWAHVQHYRHHLKFREAKRARGASAARIDSVTCGPPLDTGSALARVCAARATACFGLHLLTTLQAEGGAAMPTALPDAAMRARLLRLPLPSLHQLICDLCEVRQAWVRDLLGPSAHAALDVAALTTREATNALLFHICLWQRRYPLELLSAVLTFYEEHRALFPETEAGPPVPRQLEALMEEVCEQQYADLSRIPGLVRCDVLMTYPRAPYDEQHELMRRVAAATAAHADGADGALTRHSRIPVDPRVLLDGFVLPCAAGAAVPPRFSTRLSTAAYHELRRAFERHKRDGVRRFLTMDYGAGPQFAHAAPPPARSSLVDER